MKLLAWDHVQYIESEKIYKYTENGYMQDDHAADVKRRTNELIDRNKSPVNPKLWEHYVEDSRSIWRQKRSRFDGRNDEKEAKF